MRPAADLNGVLDVQFASVNGILSTAKPLCWASWHENLDLAFERNLILNDSS